MKDTRPALEVKEDGQIWLIPDCPVEPEYTKVAIAANVGAEAINKVMHSLKEDQYREALASAERILVSNQDVAVKLITAHPNNKGRKNSYSPGIYPIPDLKWEVEEQPIERDKSTFSHYEREAGKQLVTEFTKVAVLI